MHQRPNRTDPTNEHVCWGDCSPGLCFQIQNITENGNIFGQSLLNKTKRMDEALFSYFYLNSIQYNTIHLSKKCLYGYYVLLSQFTIRKNLKTDEKKKKTEISVVTPSRLFTINQTNLFWPLPCHDILEILLKDLQSENLSVITKKKKKNTEKKKVRSACFASWQLVKQEWWCHGSFLP